MGSLLETLIGRNDEKIAESWRKHFDELLLEVLVLNRVAELLRSMHDRGLTVVLATSSPENLLDVFRTKIDADDAVDFVVTADDIRAAKPEPDVFAVSLAKAELERGRTVVLGDSVWDAQASARARLPCVAARREDSAVPSSRTRESSPCTGSPPTFSIISTTA